MLRNSNSVDVLTLTLLGCLIIVALSKMLFPKRFNQFATLLFNNRYINQYNKDQQIVDTFEGLLFANLIVNLGIIVYLFLQNNQISTAPLNLFIYTAAIGLFIIVKVVLEKLISNILAIGPIIDKYNFQRISFRNFAGLLLLPINALLIYTVKPNNTMLITALAILFLIIIYGVFLFIKNNLNTFKKSLFYFILYLCTLEIAPYIVLYKIITNNKV
ncbi:DUF4271 domain-containing protein [Olleya namhaensis]|uniref:DUF4271 domain-containing protein n=1 Tax=Olleya namhaensis TaxID=1144750 RepID=A0A1I3IXM6_9FLAO|nr:DUF4271 domain-containing protein [Olleya namhaensis]SFI52618.1 protein of unknown function [Olleya namhaensis]